MQEHEEKKKVKFLVPSANNHYAGFGPTTGDILRNMPEERGPICIEKCIKL